MSERMARREDWEDDCPASPYYNGSVDGTEPDVCYFCLCEIPDGGTIVKMEDGISAMMCSDCFNNADFDGYCANCGSTDYTRVDGSTYVECNKCEALLDGSEFFIIP